MNLLLNIILKVVPFRKKSFHKTKKLYLFNALIFLIYSCTPNQKHNQEEKLTVYETITYPTNNKNLQSEELYPFLGHLKSIGFGTDTNRIKQIAHYAYPDISKSFFKHNKGTWVTELKLSHCLLGEVVNTSIIPSKGIGFFFARLNSSGKAIKGNNDFCFEIWEGSNIPLSKISNFLRYKKHPIPVYVHLFDKKLFIFYTRTSNYQKQLKTITNKILESYGHHPKKH